MSVRSAQQERRRFIKENFPETWPQVFADKSRLPNIFWVHSHFRKFMDNAFGSKDGIDAFQKAKEIVENFNARCQKEYPLEKNKNYARIAQTDSGETVIAIADPFMQRVHGIIPQSGEIVMMDATSNLDRNDSKIFHLVCPSIVGALPLGEIITTREDSPTILFGLELLKSILPQNAFYGRGELGPEVFMTDDSDAERNALALAYPSAHLLLCIFHVLQVGNVISIIWQYSLHLILVGI